MMWHRRETRRQTEKTKLNLQTGSNLPTHPILWSQEISRLILARNITTNRNSRGSRLYFG